MSLFYLLLLLCVYLFFDHLFRKNIINPVLVRANITPYDWSKDANIRPLLNYFDYWRYCDKKGIDLFWFLLSIILKISMIWIVVELVRMFV